MPFNKENPGMQAELEEWLSSCSTGNERDALYEESTKGSAGLGLDHSATLLDDSFLDSYFLGYNTEDPFKPMNELDNQNEQRWEVQLQQEIRLLRETTSTVLKELSEARCRLDEMKKQGDTMERMLEDLSMWSGALNPVVSMLLEGLGDKGALESENVEAWLDCSEK